MAFSNNTNIPTPQIEKAIQPGGSGIPKLRAYHRCVDEEG